MCGVVLRDNVLWQAPKWCNPGNASKLATWKGRAVATERSSFRRREADETNLKLDGLDRLHRIHGEGLGGDVCAGCVHEDLPEVTAINKCSRRRIPPFISNSSSRGPDLHREVCKRRNSARPKLLSRPNSTATHVSTGQRRGGTAMETRPAAQCGARGSHVPRHAARAVWKLERQAPAGAPTEDSEPL